MKITLKFLEPYRLLDWIHPSERNSENKKYIRGGSFAVWHKNKKNETGRPYIPGTLLRSRVLRAIEEILVLSGGKINNTDCCPGQFYTENHKGMKFLRKTSPLKWTNKEQCSKDSICPLCYILGRFDKASRGTKQEDLFHVHFRNLYPSGIKYLKGPEKIAFKRTLNRVDFVTGKAHDFFHVWEVDHDLLPVFSGEIAVSDEVSNEAKILLNQGLCFMDRICGALCVIEFEETEDIKVEYNENLSIEQVCADTTDKLSEIISKKGGVERLRVLADVVRALRKGKESVKNLPLDHEGKENHYLWDARLSENSPSIRIILKKQAEKVQDDSWRKFCEMLGEALYKKSKETQQGISISGRILGEEARVVKPDLSVYPPGIPGSAFREFLITGTLKSETPFFFGIEYPDEKQTSLRTLMNSKNQYRIPRSAIRGVLRRDLRAVIGTGCNAELGAKRPCLCEVCRIMKNITLMDARSKEQPLPEIRQRIRLNPYSGTVDEGALFDMEVGPEGLEFPFVLRYRGHEQDIPDALKNVLKWWSEERAFLSGAAATGKGRFCLSNLNKSVIELSDQAVLGKYLENKGWRENSDSLNFNKITFGTSNYKESVWQKISVKIKLASPFLNGDPIRALLHEGGQDIVSFMKYINGREEEVYAYKAESFRGVLRSALGRNPKFKDKDIDYEKKPLLILAHQDCECLLCRLFGSEYETGKLRFEDLIFNPQPEPVVFDHVAIDRFTGGAVNQKKFNDLSLPGSPGKQLCLEGCFWIRSDIESNEIKALTAAFTDINNGLYPLGAKGGIGYGWVSKIEVTDEKDRFSQEFIKTEDHNSALPDKPVSDVALQLDKNAFYYPYYFLKPNKNVIRTPEPESHHWLNPELLTGKIKCKIRTLSPLIVPDTSNDDFFGLADKKAMAEKKPYHQSYSFFSINNEYMIPGSEIRGMISSVYEAITNSCFRIFDEDYRLSWRMDADVKVLEEFKPGRIIKKTENNNGSRDFLMEEMTEVRYPFYDMWRPDKKAQDQLFQWDASYRFTEDAFLKIQNSEIPGNLLNRLKKLNNRKYKSEKSLEMAIRGEIGRKNSDKYKSIIYESTREKGGVSFYDHPTPTDRRLLTLTGPNRKLAKIGRQAEYKIIKHRPGAKQKDDFMFVATPSENTEGFASNYVYKDKVKGYLKISGPNKMEKVRTKKYEEHLPDIPDYWGTFVHNSINLASVSVMAGKDRKDECMRNRLVPAYICSLQEEKKESGITYSMTKRCERVFLKTDIEPVPITETAVLKFEILVQEYRDNAERQETPEPFQTILPDNGTVNHGDLVYFKKEDNKAVEIIPVKISRKVDDKFLAQRLDRELRPCHGEWVEEDDISMLDNYPEKKLFTRHEKGLCPACQLFGTGAYRGRVSFGFARLLNDPIWLKPDNKGVTLPVLEKPRPTWSIRKPKNEEEDKKAKVPGRKFYPHHKAWETVLEEKHPTTGEKIEPNKNNRTVQPLDLNNEFTFDICFENLQPYELGTLLYTLQLEKDLAHKLGMAKSLGFGSVEIDIESVSLHTESGEWTDESSNIKSWIDKGQKKFKEWFGADFKKIEHISDLKKLLYNKINQEGGTPKVFYPPLEKKDLNMPDYKELKDNFDVSKLSCPWIPWNK